MTHETLQKDIENLLNEIKKDKAGYASSMLHRYRRRLDRINEHRDLLILSGKCSFEDVEFIDDTAREIRKIIYDLLEKRITWQATLINQTITSRKAKGTYKGEFTTATILANAYNDIFESEYERFSAEHIECKNTWILPSEKLPELNQEIEFIASRKFTNGESKRSRFQGYFQAVGGNLIFFARSIGWGREFLIEDVECWLPKVPMPEVKQ